MRTAVLAASLVLMVTLVPLAAAQPLAPCQQVGPARFFWHYNCLASELQRLQDTYPEIAMYSEIGQSVEARPIYVLEVANFAARANQTHRPGIYIDATHHGNEIQGTEAAMRLALKLVEEYGSNTTVTRWVDEYNIYINPVVNPDGNVRDQRQNANGVDLNRNYPTKWGMAASSFGPSPASEPEIAANIAFAQSIDIDVYVSLHTGTWDYVVPRCSTESGVREHTDDDELYDLVQIGLLNATRAYGMNGYRYGTAGGQAFCWGYDGMETFAILPDVTTEQNLLFSAQDTFELDGFMEAFYYLVDNTGRYGAVLTAALAFNATNDELFVAITNHGIPTATNWTFELRRADNATPALRTGGTPIPGNGGFARLAVPDRYLGGATIGRLDYEHLNTRPSLIHPDHGFDRDPPTQWLNFTREEAEQVEEEAKAAAPPPTAQAPFPAAGAGIAAVAAVTVIRRRTDRPR